MAEIVLSAVLINIYFSPFSQQGTRKDEQGSDCGGLVQTDSPQPGVVGAKTKKFTPAALALGSLTGKKPDRGKNRDNKQPTPGTNSTPKIRYTEKTNKLSVKILRKVLRWVGGKLNTTPRSKPKTDHSEETNAEISDI